jgi:hypothetical protein
MTREQQRRRDAQERYWRRRIKQEQGMPEQHLVAQRRLTVGNRVYEVNAVLPVADIPAKVLDALLNSRMARYRPKSNAHHPAPRNLPKPEPAKARPPVTIIWDRDPVESWRLTKAAMIRLTENAALAMDLLMGNVEARDLYTRAVALACAREAKLKRMPSICPSDLPVPL